jgi:hypothetical protein
MKLIGLTLKLPLTEPLVMTTMQLEAWRYAEEMPISTLPDSTYDVRTVRMVSCQHEELSLVKAKIKTTSYYHSQPCFPCR